METETDIIERLARIEAGIAHMTEKLDALVKTSNGHSDTLSKHEARLAVLESKSGNWKTVVAVISPIVAVAAFLFALLDRIYG